MSEPLTQEEFTPAPKNFGEGWLTKSAADLCKIAICFGGFAADELVLAIHRIHRGDGKANVTTVTNALQDLYDAHKAAQPELYEDVEAARAMSAASLEKTLGS